MDPCLVWLDAWINDASVPELGARRIQLLVKSSAEINVTLIHS
jgi:hypothetical protein